MPAQHRTVRRAGAGIFAVTGRPPRRALWAGRGWRSRGRLNVVGAGLLVSCLGTTPNPSTSQPSIAWSWPRIGLASWYSEQDPSVAPLTASGEPFTDTTFTAAMWDLPFDSCVQVINLRTLQHVVVRINDRGPHQRLVRRGRLIDLSRAAFAHVADPREGLIPVQLDLLEAPACQSPPPPPIANESASPPQPVDTLPVTG